MKKLSEDWFAVMLTGTKVIIQFAIKTLRNDIVM